MSSAVRFKGAPDLAFSHNPLAMGGPAEISDVETGTHLGTMIRKKGRDPGELQFRIYDAEGRHHTDCGRFGDTFEVLQELAAELTAPAPRM